ncbi:MAG: chemotaxis protein CheW [Pirellulales bacterium]|nr:chemotaxis protein CheW [Pirellulales bacterium]
MDTADKELIAEFVIESQEGLANVEAQMLSIEAAGADIDTDLVNSVFRTMHSIKGAAGFLGLDRIGLLAHGLEEILNNLRNMEMIPTTELISTMLRAADFMKGLIDEIDNSNDADVTPFITELQQYRPGEKATEPAAEPSATTETVAMDTMPVEANTDSQAAQQAAEANEQQSAAAGAAAEPSQGMSDATREFLIECYENLDQMDRDLLQIEQDPTALQLIRNIFRTVHTIKGGAGFLGLSELEKLAHAAEDLLGKLRSGERVFNSTIGTALLAAVDKCREGLAFVEAQGNTKALSPEAVIEQLRAADVAPEAAAKQSPPAATSPAAAETATGVTAPPAASASPASGTPAASASPAAKQAPQPSASGSAQAETSGDKGGPAASESTIRVDVELLDKLMTRVGELVLARNQILQHTSKLEDSNFTSTAQRLNLITTELQESVMKTRMQPIGNVWSKFPRVVRDLSTQLGKQVRIEMEGKETELDKTIIESIKDPLTHLVRNSVDHGVETPESRVAKGKPAEGCLTLRAYHEGGQVNIEICDDGAGLNIERIRQKAVERGLVTPDAASRMTEREAAQLILLPGFSTAEKVTSVSGRGVGMDVVKTNIERIGGTLDLQSQTGYGTTVKIKIPLTLAIIPALVVTCGGDRYAIPQVSLLELVRLEGEQARNRIEMFQGAPVYRLRGELLPIVYLRDELVVESQDKSNGDILNIVVLRAEDRQFGLVVDSINDTEEIVVKPLSKQLKGIAAYAGATIMGDGKVALILDVMGAAQRAHVVSECRDRAISEHNETNSDRGTNRQTMLLLAVGERQLAMPISLVARLEELPRDSVEKSDHHEVVQYRGQIMPLVRLGELLEIPTQEDTTQPLQIVVYSEGGRSVGFVVDRVADIADAEVSLAHECETLELLASTVIQQRVTDLLNVPRIIQRVAPKLFQESDTEHHLAV